MKRFTTITALVAGFAIGIGAPGAGADDDDSVEWQRLVGNFQTFDQVGVGTGAVTGAAPWVTSDGEASVDFEDGELEWEVEGLVLAVGSAPEADAFGLDIGTPAGVTAVRGTLVCDVDGSAGGGNSTIVDTAAVPLDAKGDAEFEGEVDLPGACDEPDIAFLVRIVEPEIFGGLYLAFGAVRESGDDDDDDD